jgi:hypothetical protein
MQPASAVDFQRLRKLPDFKIFRDSPKKFVLQVHNSGTGQFPSAFMFGASDSGRSSEKPTTGR